MNKTITIAIRYVLPVLLLLGAFGGAVTLAQSREAPKPVPRHDPGLLVETQTTRSTPRRMDVHAQGQVIAARTLALHPEVSGRVIGLHDNLTQGGLINKGEVLFKVDERDYKLSANESWASVADAKARLAQEEGQQKIARREWSLFNEGKAPSDDDALALRKPQLKQAKVSLNAASTRWQKARINLERTQATAPFNAVIQIEDTEIGQLVGANTRMATLVGTDSFHVQVQVPVDSLAYINIPGTNAAEGSTATIWQEIAGERVEKEGRVVRLLSDLDPAGMMARVLVEIDDPLSLQQPIEARPMPMLLGAFVNVRLEGRRTEDLIEIPRSALQDGDKVFIAADDNTLDIRQIEIAWREPEAVFARSGLVEGESLITSRIPTPMKGMKLRIGDEASSAPISARTEETLR